MVEVRPVEDRDELRRLFDVLGAEVAERIDSRDFRFGDLDTHFPDDRRLMLAAIAEDGPVGGALAFRNDDNSAVLRIIAVVEGFRHRGIGRRLVERIDSEPDYSAWKPLVSVRTRQLASGSTSATPPTCSSSGSTSPRSMSASPKLC